MTQRLFRPFGHSAQERQAVARREFERTRARLHQLKQRIANGADLTDADQQLIANAGPQTLAYLGYEPKAAQP